VKRIFLTSHAPNVISDISHRLKFVIKNKKLAFIDTAEELATDFLQKYTTEKESFEKAGFQVKKYSITGKNEQTIRHDLQDFEVLYVSGGNTFYLLKKSLESGFNKVVKEFVENGKVYIGSSAGSIVAGPELYPATMFDDPSVLPDREKQKGFGLVDFIVFPHWGRSDFKNFYFDKKLQEAYTHTDKIILLADNQYIFVMDEWIKIVDVNSSGILRV
jgi:dipeptidase E